MLRVTFRTIRRFAREDRGVVLVIFLLVVIPLLITAAVLIDFSQTLVVKRQLTSAVDSAALSLAQLPQLTDDAEMKAKADAYIRAHYTESIGSLKATVVDRGTDTVDVTATAEIPTAFLGVTGMDKWSITVTSRVFRKDDKLEVVMVLDNSGSMAGSKIAAMQEAATLLVNTLMSDTDSKVKIGLVPFTGAVRSNLPYDQTGKLVDNKNPSILNLLFNLLAPATDSMWSILESMQGGIANWNGCVRSRTGFDISDAAPNPLNANTLFAAQFKPDKGRGKDPSKYKGKSKVHENDEGCPTAAVQPMTSEKDTIIAAITAMRADGNTNIPEGLAWGWRLISPGEPFTTGASYDATDTKKAIILLTDGQNVVNGVFSSYGQGDILNPQLGPNVNASLDAKLTTLCGSIKQKQGTAEAITLYTIAFDVSGAIATRLQQCASTLPGNQQAYYTPSSIGELQETFAEIAISLKQLRLQR